MSAWNVPTETTKEDHTKADHGMVYLEREKDVDYLSAEALEDLRMAR